MPVVSPQAEVQDLFSSGGVATNMLARSRGERIYSQGDRAASVFYIQRGFVKLTVLSQQGKEAVVGVLGRGSFFGHACLSGAHFRDSTATPLSACVLTRIEQPEMSRLLTQEPQFCRLFLSFVLGRNVQLEADLADQLCNPCEMRLARTLLGLAAMDGVTGSRPLLSMIDQQTLAGMVGTTQPRISILLSRFRKKGFIRYEAGLQVGRELTNIVSISAERRECATA